MNKKHIISTGTNIMQSTNKNIFIQGERPANFFSFTPRESGHSTPIDDDFISLNKRRTYQYYEKKWNFKDLLSKINM